MTPLQFLILVGAMTLLAACWQVVYRHRQIVALRELAEQLHLHYSADDRFRLASRIAPRLPMPGAAGVRVFDLIYGVEETNYRYIFRAEYTTGVLRSKVSVQKVATFSEPRNRSTRNGEIELVYAPPDLPLVEQYRKLYEQTRPPLATVAA